MILAIDPGVSGCLVVMREDGSIVDFIQMPCVKVGSKNRVNSAAAAAWVKDIGSIDHCYLEKVGAMPGQGTASMFSFGHAAGVVEGVASACNIPITLVTPQQWKKFTGLIGKDKDAARTRCVQLYPECREFDLKGRGQALADAVLIGRYGLRLK